MQFCLSLCTIFNVPGVQYGLRIRLMEFQIEREISEIKGMEGNISEHIAVVCRQILRYLIKNCA
jgi:hypothetical protein